MVFKWGTKLSAEQQHHGICKQPLSYPSSSFFSHSMFLGKINSANVQIYRVQPHGNLFQGHMNSYYLKPFTVFVERNKVRFPIKDLKLFCGKTHVTLKDTLGLAYRCILWNFRCRINELMLGNSSDPTIRLEDKIFLRGLWSASHIDIWRHFILRSAELSKDTRNILRTRSNSPMIIHCSSQGLRAQGRSGRASYFLCTYSWEALNFFNRWLHPQLKGTAPHTWDLDCIMCASLTTSPELPWLGDLYLGQPKANGKKCSWAHPAWEGRTAMWPPFSLLCWDYNQSLSLVGQLTWKLGLRDFQLPWAWRDGQHGVWGRIQRSAETASPSAAGLT